MSLLLLVPAVALVALTLNACWSLATQRPHTPTAHPTAHPDASLTPVEALAGALQSLAGRHPDGSRHEFTIPDTPGLHACGTGPSYCHHAALACRCGLKRLTGYSVQEVR